MINKQATIDKVFAGTNMLVRGKKYHAELPQELKDWYCYTQDGGHSILCLIDGQFDENNPNYEDLCPCPVKSVLRKYRQVGDFIAAPLKYSSELGLMVDSADDEF